MSLIDRIGYDGGATRLEDSLAFAAEHGFHYLDFSADTGPNRVDNWPDDRLRAVRTLMERHEIAVTVHTASAVNVAEYAPHVGEAVDAYLRGNIDLARRLTAHGVVVHGGMHFSSAIDARMDAARQRLARVTDYAESSAVSLFFENLNWEPDNAEVHYLGHNVEECRYFFDAIPSARFGWAFTVNHANLVPEGIDGFLDAFGVARIGEVRLADNTGEVEVHLPPGQGDIDFPAMFRRLEGAGYSGYYTMAFGSLDDKLAARELFGSYAV
jgi:sugar phosphate isomerase/epimerase